MSAARPGLLCAALLLSACSGEQSVLAPAGRDAEVLATLFWWMLGGAVVLWLLMNGLFFYVTRIRPQALSPRAAEALIIGGGIVFPTVVLAALLSFALSEMPKQREPGENLTVRITGESWWWRVDYLPEGSDKVPDYLPREIFPPALWITEMETGDEVLWEGIHGTRFHWYEPTPYYGSFHLWGLDGESLNENITLVDLRNFLESKGWTVPAPETSAKDR